MIHITDIGSALPFFEALASDVRLNILRLIRQSGEMNLNTLAKELGLSKSAITAHIKKLHDAGLIEVRSGSGVRGSQKLCRLVEEKVIIDLTDENSLHKNAYCFDIGVGHYIDYKASPTCGLVTSDAIIGELDDARYFAYPDRVDARLIWLTTGYLSYRLPNSLRLGEECTELQIGMELASEAPGCCACYPSDISFSLNGVSLGYFTSLGEFNDRRGVFTPEWWFPNLGQYGRLKLLTLNDTGCYIDGLKIGGVTIGDLGIKPQSELTFSIEAREDAVNHGGVSIFGKGFGDYDSGITVRMFYRKSAR